MNIFREIASKPWEASQSELDNASTGGTYAMPSVTVALRVFMGVVIVVFSLTVVAYTDRMAISDWRPVPEPLLMWLNIVVLIASSIAMQWAVINARQGRTAKVEAGSTVVVFGLGGGPKRPRGLGTPWEPGISRGAPASRHPDAQAT